METWLLKVGFLTWGATTPQNKKAEVSDLDDNNARSDF